MEFARHFNLMLEERMISREWVDQTLESPEHVESREDGAQHFMKRIPEYGNRWLRIVINVRINPNRAVTAFFDRRLRRTRP
jgi:Domain of unknown function (DUF4258)